MSWILPQLPQLREAFAGVTFHLYFGSGSDLEHRVRGQMIDCAVSSRRITDPKLTGIRLHREEYVFVGATAMLAENPLDHFDEAVMVAKGLRHVPGVGHGVLELRPGNVVIDADDKGDLAAVFDLDFDFDRGGPIWPLRSNAADDRLGGGGFAPPAKNWRV